MVGFLSDIESDSLASGCKMVEVANGLHMCSHILRVLTGFEDLGLLVSVSKSQSRAKAYQNSK